MLGARKRRGFSPMHVQKGSNDSMVKVFIFNFLFKSPVNFSKAVGNVSPVRDRSTVRRKELTKRNHGNSIASKKMLNLLSVNVCFTGEIWHVFLLSCLWIGRKPFAFWRKLIFDLFRRNGSRIPGFESSIGKTPHLLVVDIVKEKKRRV